MTGLHAALEALQPHVSSLALICARLTPIVFMCPILGGPHAPTHVKLGLVLALGGFLHGAAGIAAPPVSQTLELGGLAAQELTFGLALGLVTALPFDAARVGGRLVDLFRGSSAEAALPMAGTREAASGDLLYHLLLALGAVGGLLPLLIEALSRSFALVPIATSRPHEGLALHVAHLVGATFSTGLALGAPIAALALTIDLGLGLAARAAPGMNLQETGTPLRIITGGAALWALLGLIAARLQAFAVAQLDALETVSRLGRGG